MQKSVYRLLALLGLVLAFSLIAASCGNDDDDGAAPAPEPAATEAATQAPEETVEVIPTQEVDPGGTLQAVLDRGHVLCGSRDDVPGLRAIECGWPV